MISRHFLSPSVISNSPEPREGLMEETELAPLQLKRQIYTVRELNVMLDSDLAALYGVETKNLNKAVQRNLDRFPDDFMFQVAAEEMDSLRFQFGTSNIGRGGRRYLPYAFTEQGVAMLSSVLRSERAVQVNIAIMRGVCFSARPADSGQRSGPAHSDPGREVRPPVCSGL